MTHKLDKETLDKVRNIDGFPIGKDEDIINLSDPPNYTACPNPWLEDFIKKHGKRYDSKTDDYHREPFASDVSVGKNDPIYNVQSYHTKIPPKAIVPFILHYTNPGDIIFDGFGGSGMTGIATQMCNEEKNSITSKSNEESSDRKIILCDISTAATLIEYNYNTPFDISKFQNYADRISNDLDFIQLYETEHTEESEIQHKSNMMNGEIEYTVWSDINSCPECLTEFALWDIILDENQNMKNELRCPKCNLILEKNKIVRTFETILDNGESIKKLKQKPILIFYNIKKSKNGKITSQRITKTPEPTDLELINKSNELKNPFWFPTEKIMFKGIKWGGTWRAGVHSGIETVNHFYTKRNLYALSQLLNKIKSIEDKRLRLLFENIFISFNPSFVSKLTRYNFGRRGNSPLSGTLYVPSFQVERNVKKIFLRKVKDFVNLKLLNLKNENRIITTQSSTNIPQIPNDSIDYIFTDPPFGDNLMYSELNFIQESWLKIITNNKNEAIVNKSQKKNLVEYQELMEKCFRENYRILKPGRWMTVVFHNSQNKVWTAIQEALTKVGFVVADVRTLDKKQGSFKQVVSSSSVKLDLVISSYKPSGGLDMYFNNLEKSSEEGIWKFLNLHLKQLPVFVEKNEKVEIISERQKFLLFDRMVAFHVQKGLTVPISASEFYEKLHQKYPERDGMYFLSEQISEYDQKRAQIKSVEQTTLFVEDEKSTILWLNEQLKIPQTYQEIQPKFLKEIHLDKYEILPELSEILEQNFLEDEKGKWYIPDPSKLKDLEKLRERSLLREYQTYQESKGKLKQFRLEAILAGFKKNWSENNYQSIVDIAKRLPEEIIQESSDLLMYYDNASSRI